jgi:riboflavin synthase alpha subunit
MNAKKIDGIARNIARAIVGQIKQHERFEQIRSEIAAASKAEKIQPKSQITIEGNLLTVEKVNAEQGFAIVRNEGGEPFALFLPSESTPTPADA